MIYYFTPYSLEKNLFEAYDRYFSILPGMDDWAVLLDGDTAFLRSDFGIRISEYAEKFPDTGIFTCYASRCHYSWQTIEDVESNNIAFMKMVANLFDGRHRLQVTEIKKRIAGHLIMMKKKTWVKLRPVIERRCKTKKILGVDTQISYAVLNAGYKIRLMRGIYILHYLRLNEGIENTDHLK